MPQLPPRAPDVRALLEPLARHGVDFVLVGGMAGVAKGSSIVTFDVDVAYDRSEGNLERLVRALKEIGVSLRGAPSDLPFVLDTTTLRRGGNFTFETPHGDFDLLSNLAGISSYDQLRAGAEEHEVARMPVRVASLDHLIAMKRAANRPKDKLMLEEYLVIADEQRAAQEKGDAET